MIRNPADFISQVLKDYSALWNNFTTFFSNQYNYFFDKIIKLRSEFIPEETTHIAELSYFVGAYISPDDDLNSITIKTANAFKTHKHLPIFTETYKPLIDAISGGDAQIYNGLLVFRGFRLEESLMESPSELESTSFVITNKPKADVYIDLGVIPTDAQLQQIVNAVKPLLPIYFNIYIGFKQLFAPETFVLEMSLLESITDLLENNLSSAYIFIVLLRVN